MKKNSTSPTLEELLASVEHAGRDARRQQQLSEMIERMAVEEAAAKRRSVRLWSVRLVAAACLVLFMMTIVRLWYPSPVSVKPQLAQAPQVQLPKAHMAPAEPAKAASRPTFTVRPVAVGIVSPQPALQSQPVVAEPILEEIIPSPVFDEPMPTEQYAEVSDEEQSAEEVLPIASILQPASEALAQAEPAPEPEAPTQRRSIFRLRQSEPSMMDGNVLSIRLI
jgi:hypothetical protein